VVESVDKAEDPAEVIPMAEMAFEGVVPDVVAKATWLEKLRLRLQGLGLR